MIMLCDRKGTTSRGLKQKNGQKFSIFFHPGTRHFFAYKFDFQIFTFWVKTLTLLKIRVMPPLA